MILQQIFKSSQLDGMLPKSQSADSEITQSPAFGEILKDEEKKLQQAQEINALSVAGILLAMQAPLIAESAPVINTSLGSKTGNSEKQPVLQVESAKPITPAPIAKPIAKVAQPINKVSEMSVAVLSDAVNQKFVVDGKSVEVQPRVVVSAPAVPEKAMVQPAALGQNEKLEISATVRADVVSEKTVAETKSVETQTRVVVSAPAVPEKAMVQPGALGQNEKSEMPTAVRADVVSAKPIAEAKTVEVQPRVVVSVPTVPEEEMVQPAALGQNEKTTVRAEVISEKPVLEAETVESQPRIVVSAPAVPEKEMVQPTALGQNEKLEMPTTVRADVTSEKPVAETKSVETQTRVVVSAPAVPEKAMVQPAALGQNEKNTIRADVVSEKTVAETKTVEVQPRVAVSEPTVTEKEMVQPAALGQNEKLEMPTAVRADVTSEKTFAETKTVESQPRVVVSVPAVTEKEMVQPAVLGQNEKLEMPTTVRADVVSEKPIAETKTVESQPRVVVSASTVPEKEMVQPAALGQNEKLEMPTAVRADVASEKPVVETKTVETQPRVVVSAPSVTEKEMILPAALGQNEKLEMPTTVRAEAKTVESQPRIVVSAPTVSEKEMVQPAALGQNEKTTVRADVVSEKPVAETESVESQPRVVVFAPTVPEKEMVQPAALGQNEKLEMPTAVRADVVSEKLVAETESGESQPRIVVSAPSVTEKEVALHEANVQSENIEITTAVRAESEKPEAQVNARVQQSVSRVGKEAEAPEVAVVVAESHNQNEKISVDEMQDVNLAAVPAGFVNEAVVIKTAEKLPATQVDAQAAEVLEQVMSQMKVKIKSGSTSMSLQLNPKELGAIEVQMVRNTQGVSVTFFTEQASTGQLLESQMSNLRQSLKDAGVQLIGLNISQHNQPKQEGGFFRQDPQFNQTSQRNAFQTETASMERELPERIGGLLSNEVDYLI